MLSRIYHFCIIIMLSNYVQIFLLQRYNYVFKITIIYV